MGTQGEDGRLQLQDRGLRRNQPCSHRDPGLLASRLRNECLLLATQCVGVVTASQPTNAASKIKKEDGTPTETAASYPSGMTHKDMGETDRQMAVG